jgi:hypothetical protein
MSTGVRLGMSLQMEGAVHAHRFTGPVDIDLALTKYGAQGGTPSETHDWALLLKGQTTTGNADNGTLAIHTGSIMNPYGRVDLTFTQTSRKPEACSSGSGAILTGTLSASVVFHTMTKAWGDVSTKGVKVRFPGDTTVALYGNCIAKAIPGPCTSGRSWYSQQYMIMHGGVNAGNEDFSGHAFSNSKGKTLGVETATRTIYLSRLNGQRHDTLIDVTALQKYNPVANTIQVKAYRGPTVLFTGSVLISGQTDATSKPSECRTGKGNATQNETDYSALWANTAGNPLTAHLSWGGNITVPDSTPGVPQAAILVFTVK